MNMTRWVIACLSVSYRMWWWWRRMDMLVMLLLVHPWNTTQLACWLACLVELWLVVCSEDMDRQTNRLTMVSNSWTSMLEGTNQWSGLLTGIQFIFDLWWLGWWLGWLVSTHKEGRKEARKEEGRQGEGRKDFFSFFLSFFLWPLKQGGGGRGIRIEGGSKQVHTYSNLHKWKNSR